MNNQKLCPDCNELKPISEYYIHKYSGCAKKCKICANKYSRAKEKTELGLITRMYSSQKTNSKRRGHNPPTYSKKELTEWLYNSDYKSLYDAWVLSNYKKAHIPSCDRIDDYKGYSLDNIRLVTWQINVSKNHSEIKSATGKGGKANCTPVNQYTLDGQLIKKHKSIRIASRETGCDNGSISRCCAGKLHHTGGHVWRKCEPLIQA